MEKNTKNKTKYKLFFVYIADLNLFLQLLKIDSIFHFFLDHLAD